MRAANLLRVLRPARVATMAGSRLASRVVASPLPVAQSPALSTSFSTTPAPTATDKPAIGTMAFIEQAKLYGAASLIGPFPTAGRFDSCLRGLVIESMTPDGEVEATLTVESHLENAHATMHGGVTATLVDVMGSLALLAKDNKRGGVSVRLQREPGGAGLTGGRMDARTKDERRSM